MTPRERFLAVMEYQPPDRVPNWELGCWGHTIELWESQGLKPHTFHWNWFVGEECLGMDEREFLPVNMGMLPGFEVQVLEKTDRYEIIRHWNGVVTKALIEGTVRGTRASMDQYLRFPIETVDDLRAMKKRYDPSTPTRYPLYWRSKLPFWADRKHVLVLGQNCCTGFYGVARAWMGTENLSLAFYDQPALLEEMFEFIADFAIEVTRPFVEAAQFDYFNFFEDMACKSGPLCSPACFRRFIMPHYRRVIDHLKSHGVTYCSLDSDGNTEPLIPLYMEMGIDAHWPFERASNMDPNRIRKQFGRDLRIWGAVDKRELAKGKPEIDAALRELAPLIEQGGFIPTLDHTFPPDISWANFNYYWEQKSKLLEGRFGA
ncbi:MAG TPA: uroporphyrinogen decarboxylase family protein [Planctomycetota bacterium]|nr:uroporphyrinogen decarboxylase family protein [Planctomycetota bacterium]